MKNEQGGKNNIRPQKITSYLKQLENREPVDSFEFEIKNLLSKAVPRQTLNDQNSKILIEGQKKGKSTNAQAHFVIIKFPSKVI